MNVPKRIIVTGAAGFIGSAVVRALVKGGVEVHSIVRQASDLSRLNEVIERIHLHNCDITDFQGLRKIIETVQPNGIFHLAVSTIMSGKKAAPDELIATNFAGTVHLIDAAANVDYDFFITMGSFLDYGFKDGPLKESDRCEPPELYSLTKLASVLYGQSVARAYKKPIIGFRLFTPYGPYVQKGRFVYQVITQALRGEPIPLTAPKTTRDFIFVDDIVSLLLEASSKAQAYQGEIFNLASGIATTLKEVVEYVVKATNSKSELQWNALPNVSYDRDNWQADMTKTFAQFSWRPAHTLRQGLDKTIAWFRNSN